MDSLILGVKGSQTQNIFQISVKMGDLEVTLGKVEGGILNPSVHITQILLSVVSGCKGLVFSVSNLALLPIEKRAFIMSPVLFSWMGNDGI